MSDLVFKALLFVFGIYVLYQHVTYDIEVAGCKFVSSDGTKYLPNYNIITNPQLYHKLGMGYIGRVGDLHLSIDTIKAVPVSANDNTNDIQLKVMVDFATKYSPYFRLFYFYSGKIGTRVFNSTTIFHESPINTIPFNRSVLDELKHNMQGVMDVLHGQNKVIIDGSYVKVSTVNLVDHTIVVRDNVFIFEFCNTFNRHDNNIVAQLHYGGKFDIQCL